MNPEQCSRVPTRLDMALADVRAPVTIRDRRRISHDFAASSNDEPTLSLTSDRRTRNGVFDMDFLTVNVGIQGIFKVRCPKKMGIVTLRSYLISGPLSNRIDVAVYRIFYPWMDTLITC